MDDGILAVLKGHRAGDRRVRADGEGGLPAAEWPAEWLEVQYKDYLRLGPVVPLPDSQDPEALLGHTLARRRSYRTFNDSAVPLAAIASALRCAAKESGGTDIVTRPYPSAGALFPVEIYLISLRVTDLTPGVYHYRTDRHDLTLLFAPSDLEREVQHAIGQNIGRPAAFFAFSSCLQRNSSKYGARGYRFALLETGACAFGIELALIGAGLRTCWVGGFGDVQLATLLGLDVGQELELPSLLLAFGQQQEGGAGNVLG